MNTLTSHARHPGSFMRSTVTIRPGYADDHLALVRLAALDSAAIPAGETATRLTWAGPGVSRP